MNCSMKGREEGELIDPKIAIMKKSGEKSLLATTEPVGVK